MDTLLYAGSFDPVTRGHMDVIRRTAALCSQLVVAVMHNPEKHGFLSVPMRVELLETACRELPNVRVWPSEANFLTLRLPDARAAFAALQSAGILVKNLHGVHPLLDNCLRLTIGTPDDNAAMLAVLSSMKS